MAINFLNSIDLNKNQIIEPVIHTLGSAPGSPSGGQMYYNSTDGNLYVYDDVGTAWVDLTTGAVNSVDETTPGTSTGTPIVVNPTTGNVQIQSMAYAGTTNVGHVPTGGSGTTFLRGDGTWVTPTNTNQLTTFQVEDGDGTEVTISHAKEWKFVEGAGDGATIDINWTDVDNGTDADPYDLTFSVTNTDKGSSQNIFKTVSVTDTDSGYTWAATGSAIADNNSDTLTLVSGANADIDVDAASDAIRISVPTEGIQDIVGTQIVTNGTHSGISVTYDDGTDGGINFTNTDKGSSQNIFKTFTVTDTDSGYTWGATGSAVADSNSDTLTFVSGAAIDIDVDATNDAIRIAHADTSTITGAQGSSGIASITIDGNGHVTGVTPATYNNYSHPNHTGHVTSTGDGATVLTVSAITGQTPLGSGLASTDEFVISDAGVIKKMAVSVLETYMENNLPFTNNTGTVTGTGTAGTLTVWSTSGTGIEDSIVSQSGGTLFVSGNLDVSGTTTTIDSTTVAIGDNMMKYAKDNSSNVSDIGWYGVINDGTAKYSGMWYDASTGTTTPKFVLGIATTEPAATGTIATPGVLIADLEGNADTATALASSQNFSISGSGITAVAQSFDGTAGVTLNASIDDNAVTNAKLANMAQSTIKGRAAGAGTGDPQDLTATQVRTIINVADGADNYGGWNLQVNGTNTTGGAEVGSAETVNFTGNTGSTSVVGVTISNPSANVVNVAVANASTTVRGGVALATNANTIIGTQTNTAVTPDGLAATKVVSSITIASLLTGVAEINHAFDTEDISVELYDGSTGDTVYADVTRGDIGGLNTTNYVTIGFGVVPAAITTVDVVIHSHKGATSVSPAYS